MLLQEPENILFSEQYSHRQIIGISVDLADVYSYSFRKRGLVIIPYALPPDRRDAPLIPRQVEIL
jgi:hypothetical protein